MAIHALWCHPRSVSTAFERVMRERGDLDVLHEPFMYHDYLGQGRGAFPGFHPDPGHPTSYEGIRAMLLDRAQAGPVFFKDMAYYVAEPLLRDPGFAGAMSHALLVRDPAESILSYHRLDPGFGCEELGIEAQWRLSPGLRAAGHPVLVIRSEALRRDPTGQMARYCDAVGLVQRPAALSWDTAQPEGWQAVAGWHREVLASGAILPPEPGGDPRAELAALGPPYTEFEAHHRPFYEALIAAAG